MHELMALLAARSLRRAAELWDTDHSLTDCLSFGVMRRLRLATALATDIRFAEKGFRLVPTG